MLTLRAKLPNGPETLTLEDDCDMETLKLLLWSLTELPPESLRIRAGVPLRILPDNEPGTLLSMYGIGDRDTIIVETRSTASMTSSIAGSRSSTSTGTIRSLPASLPSSLNPPVNFKPPSASLSESRAGVFGILNEFMGSSTHPKAYDPLLPPQKTKKIKEAMWKHQRDLMHSHTLPKDQQKKKRNVIEKLFSSDLMAEVGEAEKVAYFEAWVKREISAFPEVTDLDTIEAELRDQGNFTEWDPEQYDFVITA